MSKKAIIRVYFEEEKLVLCQESGHLNWITHRFKVNTTLRLVGP